jgi:hypothetical protein
MEVGGPMPHGSVVACDYGVPAVVDVHEAIQRLKTGQRMRVDGSAGWLVVLEGGSLRGTHAPIRIVVESPSLPGCYPIQLYGQPIASLKVLRSSRARADTGLLP